MKKYITGDATSKLVKYYKHVLDIISVQKFALTYMFALKEVWFYHVV